MNTLFQKTVSRFAFILSFLVVLAMPAMVFADSLVVLSPSTATISSGQNVDIKVYINPNGIKDYTAKISATFPADTFAVKSFTLAPSWIPISVTGYDVVDNTQGLLMKSAGYPGGITTQTLLGTIRLSAKKSGTTGKIQIGGASLVLDSSSKNVFDSASAPVSVITISEPVTPKTKTKTPAPAPVVATSTAATTTEVEATTTVTAPAAPVEQPVPQDANALAGSAINSGASGNISTSTGVVSFVVFGVLILAICMGIPTLRRKR